MIWKRMRRRRKSLILKKRTHFLFFNKTNGKDSVGDDFIARNIQRGRDHGLPTYVDMRTKCGLRRISSFRSTPREIRRDTWQKLKRVYRSVKDIDLYTGGLAETPVSGAVIGPTFW